MTDPIDLTGTSVIVTGASSGIGASTAVPTDVPRSA
jgi:short-subunit dehydrogenase